MIINVHVQPEDYHEPVRKTLNDYAKKANIPGFRKGKVPVSMIKKMYGKGVVFEELNKVLSSNLKDYISTQNLNILGEPMPVKKEEIDLDPDGEIEYDFQYEVGLAPEFQLNLNFPSTPVRYKVEVDDATLDKEITYQQSRFGTMSNPDESIEGDILFGKISEAGPDGNPLEDGLNRIGSLNPQRVPDAGVLAQMVGRKPGDTMIIRMPQVFEGREAIRNFWERNAQNEQVRVIDDVELNAIMAKDFVFEVRKINRIEKVPVDQTLFDKVLGEGKATSEEEFRAAMRADIQRFFDTEAGNEFRARLMRMVVDNNQMPLPDAFLKKYLLETREKLTAEVLEEMYDSYGRDLRWNLLVNRVMRENPQYKVNQEDIESAAEIKLRTQYAQLLTGASEGMIPGLVKTYLENQERVSELVNEIVGDRVMTHIMGLVTPAEEVVSATRFMELR